MEKGVAASAFLISAFVVLTVGCGTIPEPTAGLIPELFLSSN